jgi:molybdopterin molybdotransferase
MKDNGFELLFDSVATKPGKPTTFGVSTSCWCFGLPGNPVSTFIQFMLLIEPFLYRLMGHDFKRKSFLAPLAAGYSRKKTRREAWLPVRLNGEGRVELCDYHGSAHINALTIADGLISVPVGVASIEKGERVLVRLF